MSSLQLQNNVIDMSQNIPKLELNLIVCNLLDFSITQEFRQLKYLGKYIFAFGCKKNLKLSKILYAI